MSQKSRGQEIEGIDLVELEEREVTANGVRRLENLRFGPCDIVPRAWRTIKLTVRAHSSNPEGKEVPLALLGRLVGKRFLIEDVVQILTRDAGLTHCVYDVRDVNKIEKEAERNKQTLVGTAHSHPESSSIQPSQQDRIAWLSLMFEFDRPLFYYIVSSDAHQISAHSISMNTFLLLKEAIRWIPFDLDDAE